MCRADTKLATHATGYVFVDLDLVSARGVPPGPAVHVSNAGSDDNAMALALLLSPTRVRDVRIKLLTLPEGFAQCHIPGIAPAPIHQSLRPPHRAIRELQLRWVEVRSGRF